MYELNKRDKAAIRAAELLGPHSAAAVREMLIKEGNARLKMDRRMELLTSGSQAAEDMAMAEYAMEEDAMKGDTSGWDVVDLSKCCVCSIAFPYIDHVNKLEEDEGETCYLCGQVACQSCIDHDAARAIGEYDLEKEVICKSCCEYEVKRRSEKDQAEENDSIEAAEDHPS